jgi:uncharacterized metal-binding protein
VNTDHHYPVRISVQFCCIAVIEVEILADFLEHVDDLFKVGCKIGNYL